MGISKLFQSASQRVTNLQQECGQWEKKIADLKLREATARQRAEAAESERQQHVLSALAENDATAQSQLRSLQKQADMAAQEARDYSFAVSQAEAKLTRLRADLEAAQSGAVRARVRDLVEQRAALGRRMEELIDQLAPIAEQAGDISGEVDQHMRTLGLRHGVQSVSEIARRYVLNTIKWRLKDAFPGLVSEVEQHSGVDKASLSELEARLFQNVLVELGD